MAQQVTLRKAAKIRNKLMNLIGTLRTELLSTKEVTVVVHDPDIPSLISDATEKFNSTLARYEAVSQCLHGIRARISRVNAEKGINTLLTEQATLLGKKSVFADIISTLDTSVDDKTIMCRIAAAREKDISATTTRYERTDRMSFGVISDSLIEECKNKLQAIQSELDDIQDQLESINSVTKIELLDSDLAILQSERLV